MTRFGLGHPIGLLAVGAVGMLVVLIALACNAWAGETSFSGGLGGLFVFESEGVFDVTSYTLGVAYRPDRITETETPVDVIRDDGTAGVDYVPTTITENSPFLFWTARAIRDGAGDVDFIGVGYSVWRPEWAGLEIIPIVSGTIKYIDADHAKLGAYGGVRIPFSVQTQNYQLEFGGGWEGDNPLVGVALTFATK